MCWGFGLWSLVFGLRSWVLIDRNHHRFAVHLPNLRVGKVDPVPAFRLTALADSGRAGTGSTFPTSKYAAAPLCNETVAT